MRHLCWVLGLVGACSSDPGHNKLEVGGGGGGELGSNDPGPDAPYAADASVSGDGGTVVDPISGRVCLVSDLRGLACAASGAGGILVSLDGATATTGADGRFTIAGSQSTGLVWHASGGTVPIVTSVMPFSTSNLIPAITADQYASLSAANGVSVAIGDGSIILRVVNGATPVVGASATTNPNALFVRYDGGTPDSWTTLATGSAGVVWVGGLAPGTPSVQVKPATTAAFSRAQLVEANAITFATVDVP